MAIERHFQGLDDRETLANPHHLLERRFDLALQQIDLLGRDSEQLRLELVIKTGDAVDLSERLSLLGDVFIEPRNVLCLPLDFANRSSSSFPTLSFIFIAV